MPVPIRSMHGTARSTPSTAASGATRYCEIPTTHLAVVRPRRGHVRRKLQQPERVFGASTEPLPRIILPAVREPGDDRNAPVIERVYVSPYGPSKTEAASRRNRERAAPS